MAQGYSIQDLIALWHQHWDTFAQYVGVIVPWWVDVRLRTLGIVLSWPAVTLYLGLLFIILFRGPLAKLIDRIQRVKGPWGTEFETGPPPQQEVVKVEKPQEPPAPEPPKPSDPPDSLASKLIAAEAAIETYKNILTNQVQRLHYERSLNMIFGTQLAFLRRLVSLPDGKLVYGAAMIHFLTHQHLLAAGGAYPSLQAWLNWLYAMGFVTYDGQTAMLQLTALGYNFVGYANDNYGPVGPWRNG